MGDSHCWETEEGLDLEIGEAWACLPQEEGLYLEMGEVLCHLDLLQAVPVGGNL